MPPISLNLQKIAQFWIGNLSVPFMTPRMALINRASNRLWLRRLQAVAQFKHFAGLGTVAGFPELGKPLIEAGPNFRHSP